ncbi:MAG: LAGLIDADG family homing endonuclease [Candidatus Paceibacterota bacterium]
MGVKYDSNEKFFDIWGPEMAYVLGFMFADGSLEDASYLRGKYVRVSSTDKDRIVAIKSLLNSEHTIVRRDLGGNHKTTYLLRIGSHTLFDRLASLGVTPHKSLTMQFPKMPPKYLADFVRGYFDGDGCAYIDKGLDGRPKRLLSVFTSGSKSFLEGLHTSLVSNIGIIGTGLHPHGSTHGAYQLRYSTRDSLRLFQLMYKGIVPKKLHLQRKYDIFTWYLKKRNLPIRDISFVLEQAGPMVKR